ncbi:hypothetical protein SRHO_G00099340 [Serrasalmus rhombeus]
MDPAGLEQRLTSQDQKLDELAQLVQGLLQRISTPAAPHGQDSDQAASPEPRGHPSHSSAFIAVPERYDGSPGMCNSFLMQCTLYITHNPSQFRLETDKVHFVISLLTGRAKEWATALWTINSAILQSESRFLSQFKAVFAHSPTGKEVGSQICDLKQGTRSAADYALDFRTLAAGSGWSEPALKTMFVRGLREDVQAELVFRGPELTLNQAIEAAISLDSLLRGRRRLLRESLPPVFSGESSPREAEPMQLGRTRLTPEEKRRRRREGLCLYCGQAGHLCSSCPTRPGQTRTAEVSVSFTDMLLNHMSIDVMCILAAETFSVSALVDSGAAGNFMDIALAEQLKIPLQPMNNQLRIKALDGRPLGTGTVTKRTPDIDLQREGRIAILHCGNLTHGKVTWSRDTNGQRVDILTTHNGEMTKHITDPDRRYGSQADLALTIRRVSQSDAGRYDCSGATVELSVTSGTGSNGKTASKTPAEAAATTTAAQASTTTEDLSGRPAEGGSETKHGQNEDLKNDPGSRGLFCRAA